MNKVYIIIPAYNEEANIKKVTEDWYKIIDKMTSESRLIIIDDGSKDNTYNIIKKMQEKYPKLEIITKKNSGHGSTVLYGYKYAIENNCNYVFQTDSDGQTVSSEFWNFWEYKDNYDLIIGNRNNRQDGISRIIVTKILKIVLFIKFHVWIKDANTPFRLIKIEALKKYIKYIPEDYHLSNVIISVIFKKFNLKIKYINITFKPRQGGKNSINIKRIINIGIKSLKEFSQINNKIEKGSKNNHEI